MSGSLVASGVSWRQWAWTAARVRRGRCEVCGGLRDGDGRVLWVARMPRARRFVCRECFLTGER